MPREEEREVHHEQPVRAEPRECEEAEQPPLRARHDGIDEAQIAEPHEGSRTVHQRRATEPTPATLAHEAKHERRDEQHVRKWIVQTHRQHADGESARPRSRVTAEIQPEPDEIEEQVRRHRIAGP